MTVPPPSLVHVLDRYRSIEGWNAEYLARWIDVTSDPGLRGGLRTILRREQAHAAELESRLSELGGAQDAKISDGQREQSFEFYGSPDVRDLDKLASLVNIFREPEKLLGFVHGAVAGDHDDEQTRELLRTIIDDEMATIKWVRTAYEQRADGQANDG
ncbi:ferritin-like domain-containing protein [Mycobacterium florentinum]|uniref:ferritin-like domain-containing protein n=1 Tax=Mycobacterium florentinum TaxID=292462 RepID=UPI00111BD6AD|nr:ferritin-like domain-containing protein [Mycobacterium florentinum]MCV7413614.1 ferritin-like domain-containing protein [Mycobacterium florentinum]